MSLSTIFLLGAGASRKAGIKGIESMTNSFVAEMDWLVRYYTEKIDRTVSMWARDGPTTDFSASDCEEVVGLLKRDILKKKGKFDIELLLEALNNLDNKDHILYSILNYPRKYSKYDAQYKHLKNILIQFIRTECENMSSVNYLYPLIAFRPEEGTLDIFTLNYDGTIEKMCKEHDIIFTDGFKEEWNPEYFLEEDIEFKLYKLHGSLYWYKTDKGKYIKLPIKNVNVDQLTYFMDEKISETLIWPMITKDYSTGPFPWLMEEFRKKLRTCDLCIILGYSFRDNYIRQMVLDELENNNNLWLLIVDHNSKEIKDTLCRGDYELQSKIMTMDDDIEKALSYRVLKDKHTNLRNVRDRETTTMNSVMNVKSMLVYVWRDIFKKYREMKHVDRIKYFVKKLLDDFESEEYEQVSLQWTVFDLSLLFGIEYYLAENQTESNYWLNIFRECSYVLDWVFSRDILDNAMVFPITKLPKWAEGADPEAYSANFQDFEPLFSGIGKSMKIIHEEDILSILNSLFESLHSYKPIQGDLGHRMRSIREMKKTGLLWSDVCDRLIMIVNKKLDEKHPPTSFSETTR